MREISRFALQDGVRVQSGGFDHAALLKSAMARAQGCGRSGQGAGSFFRVALDQAPSDFGQASGQESRKIIRIYPKLANAEVSGTSHSRAV